MGAAVVAKSKVIQSRTEGFKRFAALAEDAAIDTVTRTVNVGARSARSLAPTGKERWRYSNRPGYVPLKRSIKTDTGGKKGYWYSVAPHALHVEFGTGAHLIYGKLKFSWAASPDGWFVWNAPRWENTNALPTHHVTPTAGGMESYYTNANSQGAFVRHPGTKAQPFLRPSYDAAKRVMMQIAKEEYPG